MRLLMLALLCSLALQSNAQRYKVDQDKRKKKEFVYPSNVVKINLSSLMFKSLGVQYESKVRRNMSLALGVIYRPQSSLKLFDLAADNAANSGISPSTADMYRSAVLSRLSITPEFRLYFKKKAPKGLYLAPFVRYNRDQIRFDFKYYENNSVVQRTGKATLRENHFGGGILLGLQVLTKKHLSIDFWFAGPWFGYNKAQLKSTLPVNNINEFERAIISSNIEPIISNAKTLSWNQDGIDTDISRTGLGFRLLGINIGYNF
jgi:hypothetical protein